VIAATGRRSGSSSTTAAHRVALSRGSGQELSMRCSASYPDEYANCTPNVEKDGSGRRHQLVGRVRRGAIGHRTIAPSVAAMWWVRLRHRRPHLLNEPSRPGEEREWLRSGCRYVGNFLRSIGRVPSQATEPSWFCRCVSLGAPAGPRQEISHAVSSIWPTIFTLSYAHQARSSTAQRDCSCGAGVTSRSACQHRAVVHSSTPDQGATKHGSPRPH